ncbi:MAG: GH92 family glycosyl hydrolase [Tannerella sp.]|jgi:predicted alpha-1,2-mannosidase|nr:GH92 family glycosyl hydrolase [Tannerella sp.]
MKTTSILFAFMTAVFLTASCGRENGTGYEPVDYVNPYIGSISHMLVPTYPTVYLPNSMMRIFPVRTDFTGNRLNGLPLIVTRHRSASALNFMPYTHSGGEPFALPPDMSLGYDREKTAPYRYSVYLDEMDVEVDYAPSHQSAVYGLTFPPDVVPCLIFGSRRGELNVDGNTVSGFQPVGGETKVYFHAETDVAPAQTPVAAGDTLMLTYPEGTTRLGLRYGVSFISVEQAKKNLEREIAGYDIEAVASAGRRIWNAALEKISIEGGADNDKAVFYTSLYRVYERPVMLSEDGRYYSGFDHKVHDDEGRPFYTDDWIWDTYRAAHPLRLLIDGKAESDIIRSYVLMAGQSEHGWMPTFPGVSGDSRGMNSNHGVAMVADALAKGLQGFDTEKAYEACRASIEERSLIPWSNNIPAGELDDFYKAKGYFPALKPGEKETVRGVHSWEKRQPIAVTLGTSYDHWCLSHLAQALGKSEEATRFLRSSYNFRNVFNHATGFFHPKDRDGNFIPDIDYRISGGPGARDYYDENNGYVYRWDVQHNIADLITLNGGNEAFVDALEEMYNTPYGMSRWEFYNTLPDHTGNVGMFSMANEPSLHIPYLYNYAGQPWRTQKRIRNLLEQWFRNDLMGVPGDEDGGGMSAFVVFSQMGFYPVTPGSPTYNIGSPVFSHVRMDLGNGACFEIEAPNASADNRYIQFATLNGTPWNKPWFSHDDIKAGGKLTLVMGDKPNRAWGAAEPPPSAEKIAE